MRHCSTGAGESKNFQKLPRLVFYIIRASDEAKKKWKKVKVQKYKYKHTVAIPSLARGQEVARACPLCSRHTPISLLPRPPSLVNSVH